MSSKRKISFGYLKKLLKYYLIIAIIIGLSVLINQFGPPEVIYRNEDFSWKNIPPQANASRWNVYLDAHSHSIGSDGILTPEQSILWHIAQGYNAMILTDHNTFAKCEETRNLARTKYNNSIKVLIGMEWGHGIHINIIFPPNSTDHTLIRTPALNPTRDEIRAMISQVHNLGGIVSVNHYFDSLESPACPPREELREMGVDYFEVLNGRIYDNATADFCRTNNVKMICGTDSHGTETVYAWNALNVSSFTEEEIFNSLKAQQPDILFDEEGVPSNITTHPNPQYIIVSPFVKLGEWMISYYTGYLQLDWWGIFMILFYLYIGFTFYYLIGNVNQKIWQKIHRWREI